MKLKRYLPFALLLCLVLTACGGREEQDRAALGWAEDWTAVGDVAASEPVEGFTALENLDAMSASGLWFASWTAGEMEVRENEEGQRAEVYDAQIYLLVQEFKSEAKAAAEVEVWKSRERASYGCGDASETSRAGMEFETLPLLTAAETNPYTHGAAAFGIHGRFGVSVEVLCREAFAGDPAAVLDGFLSGLHFNLDHREAE